MGYFIYEIYYSALIVDTVKKKTKKNDCGQLTSLFLTLISMRDNSYTHFIDMYNIF
jgi:hypothetical protein